MSTKKRRKRSTNAGKQRTPSPQNTPSQRKWLFWAGAALALLAVAAVGLWLWQGRQSPESNTASGPSQPRLEVNQTVIDFGDVPMGKLVKASFKLSNTGDGTLTISHPPVPEVLEGC